MSRPARHVSLARALSKLGAASRSEARAIIEAGRVRVGGRALRDPDAWVDLGRDAIALDGRTLHREVPVYLAMHKPAGVVTTRSDERGRRTVHDLLPAGLPRVFPVGRLDLDTSGLLLFTNDTRWAEGIASPEGHVEKTYDVQVDRPLGDDAAEALARPLVLGDGTRLLAARIRRDANDPRRFTLTIREGKNRQVRRMCEAVGLEAVALARVAIGALRLGDLAPGATRLLDSREVEALRRAPAPIPNDPKAAHRPRGRRASSS